MNRTFAAIGLASLLCFASSAGAAPVALATVGGVDQLIGGYNGIGNSEAAEEAFLFDYLTSQGYDEEELVYQKVDLSGQASFDQVIGSSTLWAINFASFGITNPLVFLVKYGNAQYDHYLYANVASLQYGVVDLSQITAEHGNITIRSISHTGSASGPVSSVPEPASLSLLGLGVASLVAMRRRQQA